VNLDTPSQPPYVVLVGMDFSELADRALGKAFDIATRHESSEIHVISVVQPPNVAGELSVPNAAPLPDQPDEIEAAFQRLQTHVQVRLEAFVAQVQERGGAVSGQVISHVRMDLPGIGIAQLAAELGANLIVLGTHGRRGLARMLMGSVAETTIRYARCPVLVVPPREEPLEAELEAPCEDCSRVRTTTNAQELWCTRHRDRHGRRHTYHRSGRVGSTTRFPLTFE
jgi:nucleotide-binding universal stress UspA family protein